MVFLKKIAACIITAALLTNVAIYAEPVDTSSGDYYLNILSSLGIFKRLPSQGQLAEQPSRAEMTGYVLDMLGVGDEGNGNGTQFFTDVPSGDPNYAMLATAFS